MKRCKEECTSWARLLHETKQARSALKEQFEKKRNLDKDPDMSTADPWMRDALGLADQVLDAGEGELVGMGDFGDVEYMVCPFLFLLLSARLLGRTMSLSTVSL